MNHKIWLVLVCISIILFPISCTKSISTIDKSPVTTGPDTAYVHYTIPPGEHFAAGTEVILQQVNISKLHFLVVFDSTAIYTTDTAFNQEDINKLYGFADNALYDHHKFSARFGWNWKKGALWLYGYVYNTGVLSLATLGTIPIGKPADCTITVKGDEYLFVLNGAETSMPRASVTATGIGYKLFPYFGGNETAPHQIKIDIKELK